MHTVIWFSRHALTPAQLAELKEEHGDDVRILIPSALSSKELNTEDDALDVHDKLCTYAAKHRACAIYGVLAAPMFYAIDERNTYPRLKLPFYTAWNVQRTKQGEKPTFEHKRFVFTAYV